MYTDILIDCEITRVLLLMILQPTPQRIRPEHAQTLEKYAWHSLLTSSSASTSAVTAAAADNSADCHYIVKLLDEDTFLLLQCLVVSMLSALIDRGTNTYIYKTCLPNRINHAANPAESANQHREPAQPHITSMDD